MSDCRCEPHASGSNRCAFCRAEARSDSRLDSAVRLIQQIASAVVNPKRNGGPAPHVLCDRWLELNSFDCEASRRRQREQRAIQLDNEIAKLQQERSALK